MWADGLTDHNVDVSPVPAVLYTEGSVGADDGDREERHIGPNRKPGRTSFRCQVPPSRDTSSLGKNAHDLSCLEPGEGDPETANRHPAAGDRDHPEPAEQTVEDDRDAEQLVDCKKADRISQRCSDRHWIKMRIVVGGNDIGGRREITLEFDPHREREAAGDSYRHRANRPKETAEWSQRFVP